MADPERIKRQKREHYEKNRAVYKKRARVHTVRQRAVLRALVEAAKRRPCADCGGEFPPVCMDFDHAGRAKDGNVADMVRRCVSIARLNAEIAKCDIVCANCHRIRTAAERADTLAAAR